MSFLVVLPSFLVFCLFHISHLHFFRCFVFVVQLILRSFLYISFPFFLAFIFFVLTSSYLFSLFLSASPSLFVLPLPCYFFGPFPPSRLFLFPLYAIISTGISSSFSFLKISPFFFFFPSRLSVLLSLLSPSFLLFYICLIYLSFLLF